jgi:C4-type Zn-finger protein
VEIIPRKEITMAEVPIYERAMVEVETQFGLARDYVTQARELATGLLNSLSTISDSIHQIDTNVVLAGADYAITPFTGVKPTKPDVTVNIGSPPARAVFNNIDLSDLTIPNISGLIIHTDPINAAVVTYESALLTALKARLLADVQTDIDRPLIETAKWNRARARDLLTHQDLLAQKRAEWSKSGLPMPDGALFAAIEAEDIRYANVYDDRSGQIAIEESNLAIKVRQDAVTQATQLEGILMNFLQTTQQRLFEASRATVEAQIQVYNAEVAKYRMMTDIYQTLANVRLTEAKTKVDIYIAEVTGYKAEVEAEATRIDAVVKAFSAEVDGYRADTQVYQALSTVEVEILRTQTNLAVSRAQLYSENARIQIAQYEALTGLRIEAIKAMGAIVAQEVAGALSSIHAAASMSRSDSASASESISG